MNNNPTCQFCGEKMKLGTCHTGGLNQKSYWCDCGAGASFFKHAKNEIESFTVKVEYKEDNQ